MRYLCIIGFFLVTQTFLGQATSNNSVKNKKNRIDLDIGYAGSAAVNQIKDLMISYGYNDPTTGWLFNAGEIINHPRVGVPQIFVNGSYTNFYKEKTGIGVDLRYAYLNEISGYSENKGYLFITLYSVSAGLHMTYRLFKSAEVSLGPLVSLNSGDDTGVESNKFNDLSIGLDGKISFVMAEGKVSFWALNAEYIFMSKAGLGPYETTDYTTVYTLPESKISFNTFQIGLIYGFKF